MLIYYFLPWIIIAMVFHLSIISYPLINSWYISNRCCRCFKSYWVEVNAFNFGNDSGPHTRKEETPHHPLQPCSSPRQIHFLNRYLKLPAGKDVRYVISLNGMDSGMFSFACCPTQCVWLALTFAVNALVWLCAQLNLYHRLFIYYSIAIPHLAAEGLDW